MAKTKQTARKTNTPGMSTCQDDSTSSSFGEKVVDIDTEESRQKGSKPRYNRPIFTGDKGKVTQAPEGGRIKHKVDLQYSSDEASESQLDQMVSPECPMAEDVAKIKRTKKSVKLTIPHHPTVEGLTESFITWYKDHGMTTSLRKALEANRWTEQMIYKFKRAYIRKYKIWKENAMRYPDEMLSNEDKMEEGGLADLVGPQRGDTGRTATGMTAGTSDFKGGGSIRPALQKGKDSEKGADGSALERTTKKKKAKKTSPLDPPEEGKKKQLKARSTRAMNPGLYLLSHPQRKSRRGKERRRIRGRWRPIQLSWSQRRKRPMFNGAPGPGVEKFLDRTQRIHAPGQSVTGDSGHSSSEMAQADLDTSSCG